ncbi:conserved protein, unknown function [Plasmodium reichenowi]|uniref:ER membrane protein complex subunit 8 n=1 Tax=Plasmodium reichenowi TaxID=5854 RepID=A0A151LCP0_PLARE|nr:conserved protein, unknown function [Plasmodium reichenowi]KYN96735.1 conserved protein, unknown function [Plasmodium reichenowi]
MKCTEITIDDGAYAKIFMHSIKYSSDDVCGILIGKYLSSNEKKKKCLITNYIPLFHTHILSPYLNLAFTLVENYYKDKDERIIGYFHISSDDLKNSDIENIKVCELISEKLIKNYNDAFVCLLEFSKYVNDEDNCLNIFMKNDKSNWEKGNVVISNKNKEFLKKNISNQHYLNIYDFDDHLNCMKCDFMNPDLFNNVS